MLGTLGGAARPLQFQHPLVRSRSNQRVLRERHVMHRSHRHTPSSSRAVFLANLLLTLPAVMPHAASKHERAPPAGPHRRSRYNKRSPSMALLPPRTVQAVVRTADRHTFLRCLRWGRCRPLHPPGASTGTLPPGVSPLSLFLLSSLLSLPTRFTLSTLFALLRSLRTRLFANFSPLASP